MNDHGDISVGLLPVGVPNTEGVGKTSDFQPISRLQANPRH